jgi:hypothetical protein
MERGGNFRRRAKNFAVILDRSPGAARRARISAEIN